MLSVRFSSFFMGDNDEEMIRKYIADNTRPFKLFVNGRKKQAKLNILDRGDYRILYTWPMDFQPKSITQYTVEYPMDFEYVQGDGLGEHFTFIYITHTGSYWAGPIGHARFEYCDDEIISKLEDVRKNGHIRWYREGLEERTIKLDVRPFPHQIDKKKKCIVWEREKWKPGKSDDIRLTYGYEMTASVAAPSAVDGGCPNKCLANTNQTFWLLCNNKYLIWKSLLLRYTVLTEKNYARFLNDLYVGIFHPEKEPMSRELHELPDHLRCQFEAQVLRYLRNYILATHGNEFNNTDLKKCLADVYQHKTWTDTENQNFKFIAAREKKVKLQNESAWKKIGIPVPKPF